MLNAAKLRGFSPLKTCADFSRSAALSQKAALQMPFAFTTPPVKMRKATRSAFKIVYPKNRYKENPWNL